MRRAIRNAAVMMLGGCAAVLIACGGSGDAPAKQRFMFGTAGSGGELYMWGGAAAKVINQWAPGVQLTAQLTAGSGENLVRLTKGSLQIGLSSNELNWDLATGHGDFTKPYDARAIFAVYCGEWHWAARADFPGSSIYDFKGKKVSFGPKGGGSYQLVKYVLDALGLRFEDFDARYLSVAESVDAMRDGAIEGYIVGMGIPAPTFMDLATMPGGMKLIGISPQDIAKARQKYGFLTETVIPPKTYKGVDYEVRGLGRWHYIVSRPDFPEQSAYEIAQALTEHHPDLVAIVPAARQSTPGNTIAHTVMPLHPGAVRYFREHGYLK